MKVLIRLCLLVLLGTGLAACGSPAATGSWAFPFVRWQGSVYVETGQTIPRGHPIGSVNSFSTEETAIQSGTFSNVFPVGTGLYSVPGQAPDRVIAAERSGRTVELAAYEPWRRVVLAVVGRDPWHSLFFRVFPIIGSAPCQIQAGGPAPGQTIRARCETRLQWTGQGATLTFSETWNSGASRYSWTFYLDAHDRILRETGSGNTPPQEWR